MNKLKTVHLLLIFVLVIVIITCLLIKYKGESRVNTWILAYCTIALVFSTIYYAIQTYRLYLESQKKRYADFWERRISEFFVPFLETITKIQRIFDRDSKDIGGLYDLHNKLVRLMWEKGYMISKETAHEISVKVTIVIFKKRSAYNDNFLLKAYRKYKDELGKIIDKEWYLAENQIRILYADYGIEANIRKGKS